MSIIIVVTRPALIKLILHTYKNTRFRIIFRRIQSFPQRNLKLVRSRYRHRTRNLCMCACPLCFFDTRCKQPQSKLQLIYCSSKFCVFVTTKSDVCYLATVLGLMTQIQPTS